MPSCGKADVEGCLAGVASVQSVFRKVEHDWKMVSYRECACVMVDRYASGRFTVVKVKSNY